MSRVYVLFRHNRAPWTKAICGGNSQAVITAQLKPNVFFFFLQRCRYAIFWLGDMGRSGDVPVTLQSDIFLAAKWTLIPKYFSNVMLTSRTAVAEKHHWSNNIKILFLLLTMCLKGIKYVMLRWLYFSVPINYFPGVPWSLIGNVMLTLRSARAEEKKTRWWNNIRILVLQLTLCIKVLNFLFIFSQGKSLFTSNLNMPRKVTSWCYLPGEAIPECITFGKCLKTISPSPVIEIW